MAIFSGAIGGFIGNMIGSHNAQQNIGAAYESGGPYAADQALGDAHATQEGGTWGGVVGGIIGGLTMGPLGAIAGSALGGEVGSSIGQHLHHHHHQCTGQDSPQEGNPGGSFPPYGGGYSSPYNGSCGLPSTFGGGGGGYGYESPLGLGGSQVSPYAGGYGSPGGAYGSYGSNSNPLGTAAQMGNMQQEIQQLQSEIQQLQSQQSSGGGYSPGSVGSQYGAGQPWSGGQCPPQQGGSCSSGSGSAPSSGNLTQSSPGQPTTYTDPNGWKVSMNGSTVTITDPTGKHTITESGDPHEQIDGTYMGGVNGQQGGSGQWNGTAQTIKLPDGTQITMNANAYNQPIQNTSIFVPGNSQGQGAREIQYNNNTNDITSQSFNPQQVYQDQANTVQGQAEGVSENSQGMTVNSLYNQTSLGKGGTTSDFGLMAWSPTPQTYQSTLNNPNTFTGQVPTTPSMYINYNTKALTN